MQFHILPLEDILARHSSTFPRLIDCCLDCHAMSRIAMSQIKGLEKLAFRALLFAAAMLLTGSLLPAHAQYVGRVDPDQDTNAPTLRATAVLEYTGDLAKPTASRLVPIAVWDGERYQPGGLYLAQPVPLTVESGTQYVLQVAGTPKGLFDVNAASDVGGSWIAIGKFQKRPLRNSQSSNAHEICRASSAMQTTTNRISRTARPITPQVTPLPAPRQVIRRPAIQSIPIVPPCISAPTLQTRRPTPEPPPPPTQRPQSTPTAPSCTSPAESNDNDAPETATNATDPDRPHLEYGKPADLQSLDAPSAIETAKLSGHQDDLEEIAAVSDAQTRQPHSYVYSWTDPEDKTKIQSALETIAQKLLTPSPHNVTKTVTNHPAAHRTTTGKPANPVLPALTDEQFTAYELSYGGGATLIFSATSGQGDAAKYITLIAQPDFNGTPLVLYKQITTQRELDITPRMKLIDAVDTNADNRAELIFALESKTGRQYAIYSVANNRVEQVFTTGS